MKSLSTKSITVSRIEPPLRLSSWALYPLQTVFRSSKHGSAMLTIVSQDSVAKEEGCFLKMRSILDLSQLIVDDV
jgi:hypothetical protein